MNIRNYKPNDLEQITKLFYNTVHTINAKDYTKSQLDVWATGNIDEVNWNKSFLEHTTLVAEENNIIVGFGDIDSIGYVDRLYVHKDYQSRQIGETILNMLEQHAIKEGVLLFTTHASITAKPFFEKQGYKVIRDNVVTLQNVKLTNYIMEKHIL